ncbi:MAG: hypothetical protein ACP5ER_05135 [Candidatus Bathyarchaeales archaeon]
MYRKGFLIALLSLLFLMTVPFVAQAAIITSCTLDKGVYHQGEMGYVKVVIYNDKGETIRITELTATINYYYADGSVYVQKFFSNASLPVPLQPGQSGTFYVLFSLPSNIAPGYMNVDVRANTEIWNPLSQRWLPSDHTAYQLTLFVESPYKQRFEDEQMVNMELREELQRTTSLMYVFGATMMLLAVVIGFLVVLYRRVRVVTQPEA